MAEHDAVSTPEAAPPASTAPRWAVIGIFLILAVQTLAQARAFLMPVVMAVLLTLVFSPLRRWLERAGLATGAAALLIVGTLIVGVSVLSASLAVPVSQWVDDAPAIGRQVELRLREFRGATEGVKRAAEQIDEITKGDEPADPEVQRVVVEEDSGAVAVVLGAPVVLAQVVFTLLLLFFLLASGEMFYEKIVYVMPTFKDKRRAIRIAHDIERKLSRYLLTITLINAGLGVAIGITMAALGMPSPVLFGVIGFVFNFVPYVGSLAGIAIAMAVGLVNLDNLGQALVAAGAYFALTSIEGQLLTPYFVGRNLRLNTVMVFLSVSLWAWLWSVMGMLVATPLLVMIRTFCDHVPALQAVGNFLSARGAERENGATDGEE